MPQSTWAERNRARITRPSSTSQNPVVTGSTWAERNKARIGGINQQAIAAPTPTKPIVPAEPELPQPTWKDNLVTAGLRYAAPIGTGIATSLLAGPVAGWAAGGIAGGAGSAAAQKYEISKGLRKDYDLKDIGVDTVANFIPGYGEAPGVGAGIKEIAKYAVKSGFPQGAAVSGASKIAKSYLNTGYMPETEDLIQEMALGGGAGVLGTGLIHYGLDRTGLLGKPTVAAKPKPAGGNPAKADALPDIEALPKVDTTVVREPKLNRPASVPDAAMPEFAPSVNQPPPVAPVVNAPFGAGRTTINPSTPPVQNTTPPVVQQQAPPVTQPTVNQPVKEAPPVAPVKVPEPDSSGSPELDKPVHPTVQKYRNIVLKKKAATNEPVVDPVVEPVTREVTQPVDTSVVDEPVRDLPPVDTTKPKIALVKPNTVSAALDRIPQTGDLEYDNAVSRLKALSKTAEVDGLDEPQIKVLQELHDRVYNDPKTPENVIDDLDRLLVEARKAASNFKAGDSVQVKQPSQATSRPTEVDTSVVDEPVRDLPPVDTTPVESKRVAPAEIKTVTDVLDSIPESRDAEFNSNVNKLRELSAKAESGNISEGEAAAIKSLSDEVYMHPDMPENLIDAWDNILAGKREVLNPTTPKKINIEKKVVEQTPEEIAAAERAGKVIKDEDTDGSPELEKPKAKGKKAKKSLYTFEEAPDHAVSGIMHVTLPSGKKIAIVEADGEWFVDAGSHTKMPESFYEMTGKSMEDLANKLQTRDSAGVLFTNEPAKPKKTKVIIEANEKATEATKPAKEVETVPDVEPVNLEGKSIDDIVKDIDSIYEGGAPHKAVSAEYRDKTLDAINSETELGKLVDNIDTLENAFYAAEKAGNKPKAEMLRELRAAASAKLKEESNKIPLDDDFGPNASLVNPADGSTPEQRARWEEIKKKRPAREELVDDLNKLALNEAFAKARANGLEPVLNKDAGYLSSKGWTSEYDISNNWTAMRKPAGPKASKTNEPSAGVLTQDQIHRALDAILAGDLVAADRDPITKAITRFKLMSALRKKATEAYNSLFGKGKNIKVSGTNNKVIIIDSDQKFTPEELAHIENHPLIHDIIRHYDKLINDVLHSVGKDNWTKAIDNIGLVFDSRLHGILHTNPTTKKTTLLVNPFSFMDPDAHPFEAALGAIHTNLHELAHVGDEAIPGARPDLEFPEHVFTQKVNETIEADIDTQLNRLGRTPEEVIETGHGQDWIDRLSHIYNKFGIHKYYDSVMSLGELYTGGVKDAEGIPSAEYTPEIQKLLHLYNESRGRTTTKENLFDRTGLKQEIAGKGQEAVPPDARPDGEGTTSKPSEVDLPPELLPSEEPITATAGPKTKRARKVKAVVDEAVANNPILKKPGIWSKAQDLAKNFKSTFYKGVYEPLAVSETTRLERMGPNGAKIAKELRDWVTGSNTLGGEYALAVRKAKQLLSKPERAELVEIMDGTKPLSEASNQKIVDAYALTRGATEASGDTAVSTGVRMRNSKGQTVPFEKFAGEYFPHRFGKEMFQNKATLREALLKKGKDANGNPLSPAAVDAIMRRVIEKGERFSSSQHSRDIDLPGYSRSLNALEEHFYEMGSVITKAKKFGPGDVSDPESPISKMIKEAENPTEAAEIVNNIFNRTEVGDVSAQHKIYDKIVKAEVLSKLSQFSITNMGDFASLVTNLGFKNTLKSIGEVIANPHGSADKAVAAGAHAILKNEILDEVKKGNLLGGLLSRPLGARTTEKFIRTVGSIAARAETKRLFELAKKNPQKYLAKLGRFVEGDASQLLHQTELTPKQLDFASGRGVELSSGYPDKLTLSKAFYADNPLMRLPLLFKRFAFVNTKNMADAVRAESTTAGKIAKVTAMLAAYQVAGEAVGDIKAGIRGIVNGDLDSAVENRGDYIGSGNPVFDRIMANYLQSALFGIVGDVSESIVRKNYGKVSGTLGGPVASDADELFMGIGDVFQPPEDKGRFDALARTGARNLPIVGAGLGDILSPKKKKKGPFSFDTDMGFGKLDF